MKTAVATKSREAQKLTGEFVLSEVDKVQEAGEGKKRELVATLFREGPGNQFHGNYYTREALSSVQQVILERKKQYFNHVTDVDNPERDVRDWCSSVVEAWIENGDDGLGRLRARIEVYDDWLWARAKQAPDQLALSIEGKGSGTEGTIEGKKYNVIKAITYLNAVNWVDYPGNAGMGVQMMERNRQEANMKLKEIVEAFKALSTEEKATFLAENPDLRETLAPAAPAVNGDLEKTVKALSESMKAMEAKQVADGKVNADKIAALEADKASLSNKVEAADLREKERAKESLVEKLLAGSKLKAEHKTETFRSVLLAVKAHESAGKTVTEEDQMKHLIEDREKICVAEVASPANPGAGAPAATVNEFDQRRSFALNLLGVDIGDAKAVEEREKYALGIRE